MAILILSPHEESSIALCAALERRKLSVSWSKTPAGVDISTVAPLVVVIDSSWSGLDEVLATLRNDAPWRRCYVMDPQSPQKPEERLFALYRPFDASLAAELLDRDCELAELERQRLQHEVDALSLGQMLQHSFEAFIGLNEDHHIVYFSPGAQEMYGYKASEVLGQHISRLDDPSASVAPISRRSSHSKHLVFETMRLRSDGRQLHVLAARSQDQSGTRSSHYSSIEVSLDITQVRRLERQVEHQARLAHLGRISATMSHEINNPLAVIQSCATWLHRYTKVSPTPDLEEVAQDLMLASEQISSFVKQMTGFVRRAPADVSPKPLTLTMDLANRMVRARASAKSVRITFGDMRAAGSLLAHDPARLAHAFINVMANAVDAAAEGGSNVWVSTRLEGDRVVLFVEDDGPGVPPEIAEHLFEPFATTKEFGQGTGLGLPLTKEVVEEHGGNISISARDRGGTIARIELPVHQIARYA